MNRQQRREAARLGEARRRAAKKIDVVREVAENTEAELYFTLFGLSLSERYHFDGEQIYDVWKGVMDYFSQISDGDFDYFKAREKLLAEADVECYFK